MIDKIDILDFSKKVGFIAIPNVLFANLTKLNIRPYEYLILSALYFFAHQNDSAYPSIKTLQKLTGLSNLGIRNIFNSLEKKGYIVKTRRCTIKGNISNLYSFKPLNDILERILTEDLITKNNIPLCNDVTYPMQRRYIPLCNDVTPKKKYLEEEELRIKPPLPPNKKCEGEIISKQNLKTLSKKYSEKEVDIAYQFLKHLIKEGKQIKDPLAFLFTLLKNKTYEDITEIEAQRKQKEIEERKNKSQLRKQQEIDDYLDKKTDKIVEAMNPEEISEKLNEIKKTLQCRDELKPGLALLTLKANIRKDLEKDLLINI